MKHLLFLVVLTIVAISVKAQAFNNNSGCALEFRQICIDRNCVVSYPSTTWISATAHMSTLFTLATCSPGSTVGIEVRYNTFLTGCSGTPVRIFDLNTPITCPGIQPDANLGACASCSSVPTGVNVRFHSPVITAN